MLERGGNGSVKRGDSFLSPVRGSDLPAALGKNNYSTLVKENDTLETTLGRALPLSLEKRKVSIV